MEGIPQDFEELVRYRDGLISQKEAASDAAALKDIETQIDVVTRAIMKAALSPLAEQAKILTELAGKLKAFIGRAEAWPLSDEEDQPGQVFREVLPDNDFEDDGPQAPAPVPAFPPEAVMPTVKPGWAKEYRQLWDTLVVRPDWRERADRAASRIVASQSRYAVAVAGTSIPWWVVGVIHMMESSLDFKTHLHNGDPLSARTVQVPAGRPPAGSPPFTWEESAKDALTYDRLTAVTDWSLESALYHWHRYNGINNAYKKNGIPTPYLWSGSTHYRTGKYIADGVFDPNAVSRQLGAAVILRSLIDLGAVALTDDGLRSNPTAATGDPALLQSAPFSGPFKHVEVELRFPGALENGAGGAKSSAAERQSVRRLQEWLVLNGCDTAIDGDFGPSTETQLARFRFKTGSPTNGPLDEETWVVLTKSLRRALRATQVAPETSVHTAMVITAQQHVDCHPREVGGQNRGPWVRLYMAGKEGEEWRWCAGFVSFIAAHVARDLGIDLPFKREVGVDELVRTAKKLGRFVSEKELRTPTERVSKLRPGDLFAIRRTPTDWTHVGIVLTVRGDTFDTIEGNTSAEGGPEGANARILNRSYASKDFLLIS